MKAAVILIHPTADAEPLDKQGDALRVPAYVALASYMQAVKPESVKLDLVRDDVTVSWADGTIVSMWQTNSFAVRFTAEVEDWLFESDAKRGTLPHGSAKGGVGYYDYATREGVIIYTEREDN